MTNEDDLDGRELYRVKENNVRSSAMMEKAIKERKFQDQQKSILLNEPRILLTKLKPNAKAGSLNESWFI